MRGLLIAGVSVLVLLLFTGSLQALCVTAPVANLRSGPGTRYAKTWQVFKYMPLEKLGRKGNWYKVRDVDGDVHWIFRKLVTEKTKCAAVRVKKANIRTGPGTRYRKTEVSPAIKYDSFKVLKRKGSWVKVEDEFGERGWIAGKLLWIR